MSEDNKICTKCKNDLFLYQNKCYEVRTNITTKNNKIKDCFSVMTGCEKCITDNICIECFDAYCGLEYETKKCKSKKLLAKTYFYDRDVSAYKKCDEGVKNCLYCSDKDYCHICKSGYFFSQIKNSCSRKFPHCIDCNNVQCLNCSYMENAFQIQMMIIILMKLQMLI